MHSMLQPFGATGVHCLVMFQPMMDPKYNGLSLSVEIPYLCVLLSQRPPFMPSINASEWPHMPPEATGFWKTTSRLRLKT